MKALGLYTHTHTGSLREKNTIESKFEKGITLVALVISIIILLILAGISISALTQTGLFGKAKQAEQKSKEAEQNQTTTIGSYEKEINKYITEELTSDNIDKVLSTTENKVLKDSKENIFTVPAGFKVTKDATTVDKGIVIEDGTDTVTKGSQFVWVPVGTITKEDGTTVEIKLDRYTFDEDGKPTLQGDKVINTYWQELEVSDKGNAVAKSIKNFKNSVAINGGYYIGRYEARQNNGQITEVKTDTVWNNITQQTAADKAQKMYDNTHPFTSDLMNSYAWDTATLFAQSCGTNSKYSRQKSLNTGLAVTTGTTIDIQCNIYDMSSNVVEWTTETYNSSGVSCVRRGGGSYHSFYYTGNREHNATGSYSHIGFRPILFL